MMKKLHFRLISLLGICLVLVLLCGCQEQERDVCALERGSWFESPMLGVMTGYIYQPHSDYTIYEWAKGLGSEFDADGLAKELKQSGVDYLIFYDKWIDGFVFHDTDTTDYKAERDFVAEVAAACQKHDLRLMLYWNSIADGNPDFEKWAPRDRFGEPLVFAPMWPTRHGNLHSPVREVMLTQLREMVTRYGQIDGIWLDIFGEPATGRNAGILDAFEEKYGEPLIAADAEEVNEFYKEARNEHLRDIRRIVDQNQRNCILCINGVLAQAITEPGGDADCVDHWVHEGTECSESTGDVCLQSEGTPIEFRNIVLRLLD